MLDFCAKVVKGKLIFNTILREVAYTFLKKKVLKQCDTVQLFLSSLLVCYCLGCFCFHLKAFNQRTTSFYFLYIDAVLFKCKKRKKVPRKREKSK